MLGFERAGVASRAGAKALDMLALAGIYLVLAFVAAFMFTALPDVGGAVVAVVVSPLVYFGWFVTFETVLQRTPGKAAFGLRVVGADGTPVRFQQALLRNLVGLVELVFLGGFIAIIVTLFSSSDQRVGDMVAGTLVVRERSARSMVAPARFSSPRSYEAYVSSLDVTAMTNRQYELVRAFLLRVHELRPMARGQLAVRLANPLAGVLSHSPPPGLHPEIFLACVAAAWQSAHGSAEQQWASDAWGWPHPGGWGPPVQAPGSWPGAPLDPGAHPGQWGPPHPGQQAAPTPGGEAAAARPS